MHLNKNSQEQKAKIKINPKMQVTHAKKSPRLYVLAHPEKCRFSAHTAICGHTKNALMALPAVFI
jgi:hypothetical protein